MFPELDEVEIDDDQTDFKKEVNKATQLLLRDEMRLQKQQEKERAAVRATKKHKTEEGSNKPYYS